MRKLKTSDIPACCRAIKKLGIKDKLQAIAKEADNVSDMWDKGFDLVWGVFDAATEQEGENILYAFLAGPFELSPQEVADLDIEKLFANLQKLAEENNLIGFFKSAAKLMK